jgi:hypothetical protein
MERNAGLLELLHVPVDLLLAVHPHKVLRKAVVHLELGRRHRLRSLLGWSAYDGSPCSSSMRRHCLQEYRSNVSTHDVPQCFRPPAMQY